MADIDPSDHTIAELEDALAGVDDPEALREIRDAEVDGTDRKGAKAAIDDRLDELDAGEDAAGDEGEDSAADRQPDDPSEEALEEEELSHPTADKRHVRALADGEYRDMWVYCETQRGELIDVSREMLGKARELMDEYNDEYDAEERVVAVLVGHEGISELADECVALGADFVVYHEDDRLERFRHKPYTEVFSHMARAGSDRYDDSQPADWKDYDKPRYVLFPATNNGRDLSAQVQAELDSGLASDCSGLFITEEEVSNPVKTGEPGVKKTFERVLHMKRPDFSGFEYSTILCLDNPGREFHPQGASVIPGSFEVPEPDPEREGETVEFDVAFDDDWLRVEVTEYDQLEGGVDLTGREVIVALGRGIGDDPTRGMELGLDLVDAFEDADLGISRGIVTSSYEFEGHVQQYAAEERQIGETGQVVEPELYVAAGISGAVQHKVGMDESDTIVAVNTDSDADIRDFSDYFVEGDLFEVLPRLTDAVESGELDVEAIADGGSQDD
jgi:electron transfer flavoprotein alpha subunit